MCESEWLEYTLFAPQRDGELEGQLVGLFVDYRDLSLYCPEGTSVISLVLQLNHKIQHRDWRVFNSLSSAERTVVNWATQVDLTTRGTRPDGFTKLPDGYCSFAKRGKMGLQNFWDRQKINQRWEETAWGKMKINITQYRPTLWHVNLNLSYDFMDGPMLHLFLTAVRDVFHALMFHPTMKIHAPFTLREERPELFKFWRSPSRRGGTPDVKNAAGRGSFWKDHAFHLQKQDELVEERERRKSSSRRLSSRAGGRASIGKINAAESDVEYDSCPEEGGGGDWTEQDSFRNRDRP